jgi:hypothetical protein
MTIIQQLRLSARVRRTEIANALYDEDVVLVAEAVDFRCRRRHMLPSGRRVGVDRMIEDASLARTVVVVLHNVADESRWQHLVGKSALVVEDSGVLNPHFAIDGSLVRDVVSIQYRGPRHEYACPPPGT